MLSKKFTRYLGIAGSLCIFFVVAIAIPQEQYKQEIAKYPRLFLDFKSTLKKLSKSHNPTLIDDPRLQGKDKKGSGPLPKIYRPFPDYESDEWKASHRGTFTACVGPRGQLLNESLDDQVSAYEGVPKGFPTTLFGSHEAVGFDGQLSFDRYTRYGAYGFGEEEENVHNWAKPKRVNWDTISWGKLQTECVARNADRFSDGKTLHVAHPEIPPEVRSAVLLRSWIGKEYLENDLINMRSMIMELSLQSGGEYEVFLLVQVRDESIDILDEKTRQQLLKDNIPPEFWDITHFWNVGLVRRRYTNLNPEITEVHRSQWLPVQNFMLENPQFEYVWNWEVDVRWTGHLYELVDKSAEFGRRQPRRGLWERNERFYIPSYHGDYDHGFRKFVEGQTEQVTHGVWGRMPMPSFDERRLTLLPEGPSPPVPTPSLDKYEWGVGEEADLLGFLPYFNPHLTEWVIRYQVYGYDEPFTPRRACIVAHERLSRRLILAMDYENLEGRHMGSEMWPPSAALMYGLKAVTVPHPIYTDRMLPGDRVSRWFNSGIDGRSGSSPDSPFSWGREYRFNDVSWYFRCNLPGKLYWNFLGWEKDGTGGPRYEKSYGRHILPSILFHPIKNVVPDAESTSYYFEADIGVVVDAQGVS
ncbi:hypothetical protein EYZ11_012493 [Aspergillus tanneri]|uniref:Uncharacterized protein n=1 Tax=Aspergillus tanneri TaxID=1220188 RepID=A0A4S3J041_9EURO|nr:hypothetical protein EYZ11_012493 [Aspergillus tanneri]